ncbi:MAG: cytochrome P450 [Chloroflexi bacterium]|nr:cytochrome P450 [Chloroflexota bacterium]
MTAPAGEPTPQHPEAGVFATSFITNPYPVLQHLREATRAHYEQLTGRWILTRQADVAPVLADRSHSRDPRNAAEGTMMRQMSAANESRPASMLFLDPPDHTRLRGLVNKAFTPRAVERMRPRTRQIADELLDAIGDRPAFDIIADYAAPLPTTVIAEMLGVDSHDRAQFKAWSDLVVAGFNPFLSAEEQRLRDEAGEALRSYFAREIAARRGAPREDLLANLIHAEEEGDRLTEEEMITTCVLLLVAGNVTTTDLIGNGVMALLQNPDQLCLLRDDPSLIVNAVEEMLRFDSPVTMTGRILMEDAEIAGCPMHKGQSVTPSLASANHDPAVHPDPERFDITRSHIEHHSFGGGAHYCLGAPLARMEAQVAVNALLARFPGIALGGGEPVHRLLPGFRGFTTIPVVTRR